jgi:ketosteroid isomerase-like protein
MTDLEAVRASYEAFERGDRDGALAAFADDVVWEQAQGLPHGGVYHGLEAVRRNVFDPLDRDWWSAFSAVPQELLEAGSDIVVLGRYTGTARATGRRLDVPFVHVWTFEEGRAVRFRQFLDTAGWNAALAPGVED